MTTGALSPATVHRAAAPARGSDGALVACAASAPGDAVVIVGDSRASRSARLLGLPVTQTLPAARTDGPFGARDARTDATPTDYWGVDSAHAFDPCDGCVIHALGPPRDDRDVRVAQTAGSVRVYDDADRGAWVARGVAPVPSPVPSFDALAQDLRASRDPLRARMGIEEELLVCPLADHPSEIDSRQFGFMLGLMAIARVPVAGVLPRGATNFAAAWRHIRGLENPCRVFETETSTAALVGAADIALVPGASPNAGANRVLSSLASAAGARVIEWGQRAPGKLRHTPALAGPVIDAAREMIAQREGAPA